MRMISLPRMKAKPHNKHAHSTRNSIDVGNIKRQSTLSIKKTLDLISEKYGHTLPEAGTLEEVVNDDAIPDLLADKMDYSGKSVLLDEGRSQGVLWALKADG